MRYTKVAGGTRPVALWESERSAQVYVVVNFFRQAHNGGKLGWITARLCERGSVVIWGRCWRDDVGGPADDPPRQARRVVDGYVPRYPQ